MRVKMETKMTLRSDDGMELNEEMVWDVERVGVLESEFDEDGNIAAVVADPIAQDNRGYPLVPFGYGLGFIDD